MPTKIGKDAPVPVTRRCRSSHDNLDSFASRAIVSFYRYDLVHFALGTVHAKLAVLLTAMLATDFPSIDGAAAPAENFIAESLELRMSTQVNGRL